MAEVLIWKKVHPTEVKGKFRSARKKLGVFLLGLFLVTPWLRINHHPVLLFDIPERKFSIFGFLFWAHDVPLLLFVAGIFTFSLMLITAVFGRVWCGWACPQTVYIEHVFRQIERWVEGDAVTRRKRDAEGWSTERMISKGKKWLLFAVAAAVISHSFLAYFVGTERLSEMVTRSPSENPVSFFVMLAFFGFTLFNFGWFRERFCTSVCPYGRFQTVLLDEDSWVVSYDAKRGEPRKGTVGANREGDCISCNKCVAACPTGIDIRKGLQLECIACTACMDACDSVMRRLKKPEALIGYSTLRAEAGESATRAVDFRKSVFRARPAIYFAIIVALTLGLFAALHQREPVDFEFIRAVGAPYDEVLREGMPSQIINRFNVDVHNLTFSGRTISIRATGNEPTLEIVSPALPLVLAPGEQKRISVFMKFSKSLLIAGGKNIPLSIIGRDSETGIETIEEGSVRIVGPY